MSVTNESNKIAYTASGNSSYPIPFFFTDNQHIKLYYNDSQVTSGFTVTGANNTSGGTLTFTSNAPASGKVVITREIPFTQESTLNNSGPNDAATTERMFDKLTLIAQQLNEKVSRAIKFPLSSSASPQIVGEVGPGKILQLNETGDALEFGLSASSYTDALDTQLGLTVAAKEAAELARDGALTSETNAQNSKDAAAISETNAASSASQADAAKIAAQNAAAAAMWRDVVYLTTADSPRTILATERGKLFSIDCSAGQVVINLPMIAGLDLATAWAIAIKKTDTSGNSVLVNRGGTDLIDAGSSKTIGSAGSGAVFVPDTDPSPDGWTTSDFGASAGNMVVNTFTADGSTLAFTLSTAPGAKNNVDVYVGGVYQEKNTFTVSGTTLTLSESPASGTLVECVTGTTLPIGTPADATVTISKLAQEVINLLVPVGTKIESIRQDVPAGFISGMNKSIGKSSGDYNGAIYFALFGYLWAMPGVTTTAGDPFRISSAKGASALADWDAGKTITIDFETNEIFTRAKGTSRNLGSYQADDLKSHAHSFTSTSVSGDGGSGTFYNRGGDGSVFGSNSFNTNATGGTETRPKNVALNVFFKY